MHDKEIINLYLTRFEIAIAETERKYGKYCHSIAYNILYNDSDAEECVNDTYVKVWNSIPPNIPEFLSAYIGKITRNIALNRYTKDRALKRKCETDVILDEVAQFVPDKSTSLDMSDDIALRNAINSFVSQLPVLTRVIFVRRYWYLSSVKEIAKDYGYTESKVKVTLLRTRNKFKEYLESEGIVL